MKTVIKRKVPNPHIIGRLKEARKQSLIKYLWLKYVWLIFHKKELELSATCSVGKQKTVLDILKEEPRDIPKMRERMSK